jgi:hypothetical protein
MGKTLSLFKNSTLFFAGLLAVVLISNSAEAQWLPGKRPPSAPSRLPSIGPLKVLPKRNPPKHIPLVYKRPVVDPRSQLEAYALCQTCAFVTPNPAYNQNWPRKIPPTVIPYAPGQTAPKWFRPFSTVNWREIWGIRHARAAGPKFMRWGRHVLGYTSGSYAALRRAAEASLKVPRGQDGKRKRTGNVSKGMCTQAVMDILVSAGILDQRIWKDAAATREVFAGLKYPNGQPKFVDIIGDIQGDPKKAPLGAILIYDDVTPGKRASKRYGHIEVTIPDPKEGKVYWSDHYKPIPMSDQLPRKLRAAFLPLPEPK